MENKEENSILYGREKAIAFMLRKNKPGIAKRKPVPELELIIGEKSEEGVFFGKWQPKDRDGVSLGKIFNVFAAPQDLTDASGNKEIFTYDNAVKRISELKDWNGFDGTSYSNDKEIYQALKDGSYDGGWIIPTRELLIGRDVNGNKDAQEDNLYKHRDTGSLKGTFTTAVSRGSGYPDWYWSSTVNRESWFFMDNVQFSDANQSLIPNNLDRLSCRPVRLVAA